jgi:hypothetical protein
MRNLRRRLLAPQSACGQTGVATAQEIAERDERERLDANARELKRRVDASPLGCWFPGDDHSGARASSHWWAVNDFRWRRE